MWACVSPISPQPRIAILNIFASKIQRKHYRSSDREIDRISMERFWVLTKDSDRSRMNTDRNFIHAIGRRGKNFSIGMNGKRVARGNVERRKLPQEHCSRS